MLLALASPADLEVIGVTTGELPQPLALLPQTADERRLWQSR